MNDQARFAAAIARFDAENKKDPKTTSRDGTAQPYELAYSQWLADWVLRLAPDAPESLRLAARCQHLCRWEIPRDSYPATRAGYLKWRQVLKEFHANKAAEILNEIGYDAQTIREVRDLNLKKDLSTNPDCQTLEDALCLVFLERQFANLAAKATEEKMVAALQKCWAKMSPKARQAAMTLSYPADLKRLLELALMPTN